MPEFEKHVFVCTNTRPEGHPRGCCSTKCSNEIRDRLKALAARHGLKGKVRINAAGCLDQCEHGVTLVVYPEAVWYGFVTPDDVDEVFESHIVGGVPVERLRLRAECLNTKQCEHKGAGNKQSLP
ncbi:MAG: (2Fe-2S) ferredoxin domain-containing protein [Phycisphaerales bacterium]|nr:(2Fe-2S) ferredoxin domain-containing protein [Phycisphaerales bacterium]